MSTCATCKYWVANLDTGGIVLRAGRLDNAPADFRLCARAFQRGAPCRATGHDTTNVGLATAPDFGCTEWEAKE